MDGKEKVAGDYHYNSNQILGSGTWGVVYKGRHKFNKDKLCAVKKMNKFKIQATEVSLERYKNEVISLEKAGHIPEIIKIYDFFKSKSSYYIITEYEEGCYDLFNYIKQNPTKFTERQSKIIWGDLLRGIRSLHRLGITHRDLKLHNIIYHPEKNKTKIIDFGLATTILANQGKVGSPLFMSPQVIKGQKYTEKCDIWSLGIVFYWMICHASPYGSNLATSHIVEVMRQLAEGEHLPIPKGVWMSKNCEEVIKSCLKWQQEQRMEIDQILKLKFFKEPNFNLKYTRWLQYYEPELSFVN